MAPTVPDDPVRFHASGGSLLEVAMAAVEGLHLLSLPAGGGTGRIGGAHCWYSTSSMPLFSGAALFSEELFSPGRLREINSYFRARERPYSLVTVDGLVSDAAQRLAAWGYVEFDWTPLLVLRRMPDRWRSGPAALRISLVRTAPELAAFRSILSRVFAIPALEAGLVLSDEALQIESVRHYLAYAGDEPAGTASLVLTGRMAGVWNVGTTPEHRRRGVAAELMHHIIADAAACGYRSSMLLSSFEGLPLYERLGYENVSTLRMFVPPRGSS